MLRSQIIKHRRTLIILLHILLAVISFSGAFAIRFDGIIEPRYIDAYLSMLPVAVAVKLIAIWRFRLLSGLWKYIGMDELFRLFKALTLSTIVLMAVVWILYGHGFPRMVFVIDYMLALFLMAGVRAFSRFYREHWDGFYTSGDIKRAAILGAGHTGDMAYRMLRAQTDTLYKVVAYLDDDTAKQGMRMHDVPVRGPLSDLPDVIKSHDITDVVFAIPTMSKQDIASQIAHVSGEKLNFHIMPTFRDATSGRVLFDELRNVEIEDLLGRNPIALNNQNIIDQLNGQTVLITGAGGSIGAELSRQVAACHPHRLVLVDFGETPLFHIQQELLKSFPQLDLVSIVGDIKHPDTLNTAFAKHQPHIVYHAAAYKHVPLMEAHPVEAVLNNIFGTYYLARAAIQTGVEHFVMISTDKAVRPTNIMGATKRYAELLLTNLKPNGTTFIGVRFGNVLGSNGSVIPTFRWQIGDGGPVTVTHPDITRFFITIEEAVGLVLQAGGIGKNADMFVLDMGEPVKIADMARSMIELSGLKPEEDIKIKYTGLRPGEKLYEELVAHGEEVVNTEIPKLQRLSKCGAHVMAADELIAELESLKQVAYARQDAKTRAILWELVRKHDPDIMEKKNDKG